MIGQHNKIHVCRLLFIKRMNKYRKGHSSSTHYKKARTPSNLEESCVVFLQEIRLYMPRMLFLTRRLSSLEGSRGWLRLWSGVSTHLTYLFLRTTLCIKNIPYYLPPPFRTIHRHRGRHLVAKTVIDKLGKRYKHSTYCEVKLMSRLLEESQLQVGEGENLTANYASRENEESNPGSSFLAPLPVSVSPRVLPPS